MNLLEHLEGNRNLKWMNTAYVPVVHNIKLGELVEMIKSFKES